MSGPIVRSYGVPGWDEIFGNKDEASKKDDSAGQAKPTGQEQENKTPNASSQEQQKSCDGQS